jgi:ribosome-associated heat shock protein Hsp15
MTDGLTDGVRIDKWLKVARFFKKREDAADAVENGAVRLNGEKTRPAKHVKPGDKLSVRKGAVTREVIVRVVSERSVSAEMAKMMFDPVSEVVDESALPEVSKDPAVPTKSEILKIWAAQDRAAKKEKWRPDKKQAREARDRKYRQD